MVTSYDEQADGGRLRKYYRLTSTGKGQLADKKQEWMKYAQAVQTILNEGATYAAH
jgi:PadR family transcriptional regulator PadR